MSSKLRRFSATYGLALVLGLGHAVFAWLNLAADLREFQKGEQIDLSTHALMVTCVDAPVAIPVLLGMQALGYGYGNDDAAKARTSDLALVIAGSVYWFFGGWFAGKLLLNASTRAAIILGFVSTAALALLLCLGRGPLILLLLLGMLPLLLGVTDYIVRRTTVLKYERHPIQ